MTMHNAEDIVKADLEYIADQLGSDVEAIAGKKMLINGGTGVLGFYHVQPMLHVMRRSRASGSNSRTR